MFPVLVSFLGKQIAEKNWLPLIAIGVMAWLWWQDARERDARLDQAKVDHAHAIEAVNEDVMHIRRTQDRLNRVNQISKQPKGDYEMVIIHGDS